MKAFIVAQAVKSSLTFIVDRCAVTTIEYALIAAGLGLIVTATFSGVAAPISAMMLAAVG